MTTINGLLIDWASKIPDRIFNEITENPIGSREKSEITRHTRLRLPLIEMRCILTGENRQGTWETIRNYSLNAELVTLVQNKTIDSLLIQSLEEQTAADNVIEFNIVFKKVDFAELQRTKEAIPVTKNKGLQQKQEVEIPVPDYLAGITQE